MLLKKKSYHITPSVKTVQWLFPSKTKIKFFAVSVQQGHTWSALLFSSYLFSYNSPCPCLCTSHWIPCPSTGALGSPCLRGLDFFLLNDPSIWDAYPSDAQVTPSPSSGLCSFVTSSLWCTLTTGQCHTCQWSSTESTFHSSASSFSTSACYLLTYCIVDL